MRKFYYLLFLLSLSQLFGQNYNMTAANDGQLVTTCNGKFHDDGGSAGDYSPNIVDRTLSFKAADPTKLIILDFTSFHTQANYDVLEVFHGPTATGVPALIVSGEVPPFTVVSATAGGTLTFRFNSNSTQEFPGWVAQISCATPCDSPIAIIDDDSDVDICPDLNSPMGHTVEFSATGSYGMNNEAIAKYIWSWGDGTVTETTSPTTTHTFPNTPGFYIVSLRVRSTNTAEDPEGCRSNNIAHRRIRVLPPPDFTGSTNGFINVYCGDSVDLVGIGSSQTITQQPPRGVGGEGVLPDTDSTGTAIPVDSPIDLTGYFPDDAVMTEDCLPEVVFDVEHSYAGDLVISLVAPNEEVVKLMDGWAGGVGQSGNLGYKLLGYCVNGADNEVPGCVAPYRIINNGGLNWLNGASLTNFTQTCEIWPGPCENSNNYYKQDEYFNSSQPFTNLLGVELNGIWKLRVEDWWAIDDGFMSGWQITFPANCFTNLDVLTPILNGGIWTGEPGAPPVPDNQNVSDTPWETTGIDDCPGEVDCFGNRLENTITVGPFNTPGSYIYTFTVSDDYGCEYTRTVTVNVSEKPVEFDIPNAYCEETEHDDLPTTSSNGITGTWDPPAIDTSEPGDFTYVFTPDEDQCALDYTFQITINPRTEPTFTPIPETFCVGQDAPVLPTTSLNLIIGQWSPAEIDTSVPGTYEYTFTPDGDICAKTKTIIVEVVELEESTFDLISSYCLNATPDVLPNTSLEGNTGHWEPATIDTGQMGSVVYTFYPDDADCVESYEMTVIVDDEIIPQFDLPESFCLDSPEEVLPTTSDDGLTGFWEPSTVDTSTVGTVTYTFTPEGIECAIPVTVDIEIVDKVETVFEPFTEAYCQGEEPQLLPVTSLNNVEGQWVPADIDTSVPGTYTFIFTPNEDECALPYSMEIQILEEQDVSFDLITQYCANAEPEPLPNSSLEGVPGHWSPAVINTSTIGTTTYTFVPDVPCSEEYTIEITINDAFIPSFDLPTSLCEGDIAPELPGTSEDGIDGTWNHNGINTGVPGTITYVFTPGDSAGDCVEEYSIDITIHEGLELNDVALQTYCANPADGTYVVDLTGYEGELSGLPGVNYQYYSSLEHLNNGQPIPAGATHDYTIEEPGYIIIYVVGTTIHGCESDPVGIPLQINPSPDLLLPYSQLQICDTEEVDVTAMSDDPNAEFEWHMSDGSILYGDTQTIDSEGVYTVIAHSPNGCDSEERTITVTHFMPPIIEGLDFSGNTVIVSANNSGGGQMDYSLDGILWQESHVFDNLIPGQTYTVWVRSGGCTTAKMTFTVPNIPNFISPNGDGINDTWAIRGFSSIPGTTLKIFNRYGKIFVDTNLTGDYEWNGKYMGDNVASGDYWYIIEVPESLNNPRRKFVGHITVRNH